MRDSILELLGKDEKALDSMEIANNLHLTSVSEITSLMEVLQDLEQEMLIYRTRKDKYMLFNNSHLLKGKIHVNKRGYAFVSVEGLDDDYYIPSSLNIDNMSAREILSKAIILRYIVDDVKIIQKSL